MSFEDTKLRAEAESDFLTALREANLGPQTVSQMSDPTNLNELSGAEIDELTTKLKALKTHSGTVDDASTARDHLMTNLREALTNRVRNRVRSATKRIKIDQNKIDDQ